MTLYIFLHLYAHRNDVLLLFLQIKNINEYRYSEKESVQLCLALLKLFLFFGIP